jgi:hypothetical protein
LLLVEIVEPHPNRILRSQPDDGAQEGGVGDEQHPDAIGRGVQRAGEDRGLLGLLTWLALLAYLILGSIYFWREIRKKQK